MHINKNTDFLWQKPSQLQVPKQISKAVSYNVSIIEFHV